MSRPRAHAARAAGRGGGGRVRRDVRPLDLPDAGAWRRTKAGGWLCLAQLPSMSAEARRRVARAGRRAPWGCWWPLRWSWPDVEVQQRPRRWRRWGRSRCGASRVPEDLESASAGGAGGGAGVRRLPGRPGSPQQPAYGRAGAVRGGAHLLTDSLPPSSRLRGPAARRRRPACGWIPIRATYGWTGCASPC